MARWSFILTRTTPLELTGGNRYLGFNISPFFTGKNPTRGVDDRIGVDQDARTVREAEFSSNGFGPGEILRA